MIADLVERFEEQGDAYESGAYNETQLRQEFIDPMFEALDWDMQNRQATPNNIKTSFTKTRLRSAVQQKRLTTVFGSVGRGNFFSKRKPSVDIKHDATPAYQLRCYAWSAKLPLSVLLTSKSSLFTTVVLNRGGRQSFGGADHVFQFPGMCLELGRHR